MRGWRGLVRLTERSRNHNALLSTGQGCGSRRYGPLGGGGAGPGRQWCAGARGQQNGGQQGRYSPCLSRRRRRKKYRSRHWGLWAAMEVKHGHGGEAACGGRGPVCYGDVTCGLPAGCVSVHPVAKPWLTAGAKLELHRQRGRWCLSAADRVPGRIARAPPAAQFVRREPTPVPHRWQAVRGSCEAPAD